MNQQHITLLHSGKRAWMSSQACLGLSAGVGVYSGPGAHEDHHDPPPGSPPEKVETKPTRIVIGALIS